MPATFGTSPNYRRIDPAAPSFSIRRTSPQSIPVIEGLRPRGNDVAGPSRGRSRMARCVEHPAPPRPFCVRRIGSSEEKPNIAVALSPRKSTTMPPYFVMIRLEDSFN